MEIEALKNRRDAFAQTFRAALEGLVAGDVTAWVEMWADDGRMEFPYGPEGYVPSVEGKAAIYEYLRDYPTKIRIDRVTELNVYQALDPDRAVVEFAVEGEALPTGRSYRQRYVGIVTLRGDKIANYRDYWNPLVAIQAFGGPEALQHAFTKEGA
jgi:ketosteroid isomerase-like protein